MAGWLNLGQNLKINAKKFPRTVALKDAARSFTYPQVNARVNKLAHSLVSLGLTKGDKVAVLLENSIEIVEVFLATAKTGIIIVPINFRLVSAEVQYIVENSDAKAFIVHDEFTATVEPIKADLKNILPDGYIVVGQPQPGYQSYEGFIENSPETEPEADVRPEDTWILIYTSGTTGKPKGAMLSHGNLLSNVASCRAALKTVESDRFALTLPMFHSFMLTVCVLLPLVSGSSLVLVRSLHPLRAAIEQIVRHKATILPAITAATAPSTATADMRIPSPISLPVNLKLISGMATIHTPSCPPLPMNPSFIGHERACL